jgi:hypothetical protein
MRLSLICFFMAWTYGGYAHASASQKAYLFIAIPSYELNSHNSWYFHRSGESRLDELVRIFESRMKPLGFETEIVIDAQAHQLRFALTNATTAAVFWIGHAISSNTSTGMNIQSVVLDSNAVNVANLFQDVHPNIRWVGIVGCYMQGMIDRNKLQGRYKNNPILRIDAVDGLGVPSIDLNRSTSQAYIYLAALKRSYPQVICALNPANERPHFGRWIDVKRSHDQPRSHISFMVGEQFVGYLAKDEESVRFWVNNRIDTKRIEALRMDTRPTSDVIENLQISTQDSNIEWKNIRRADGTPIGKSRNVYVAQLNTIPPGHNERPPICPEGVL